ncbi:MAG: HEAT repeat domain-containing protein [Sphingomonas sp.]|uniref:HEAT repeat domain-containing protein n=1 Tax=Sphingomonas sp. TaxID=28214 RepID=UPI003F818971
MHGIDPGDHVARLAELISLYGALGMAGLLLFLVMRRDRRERGRARELARMRDLTREIMALIGDPSIARPTFDRAQPRARLAAIGNIGQLVRGDDRDRLISFVEEQHLLDRAMREVGRGSRRKRVEAIRLVGTIGGPRAVDTLRDALAKERDEDVRLETAITLARIDGLPPPDTLIAQLRLAEAPITPLHRALFRMLAARRPAELFAIVAADLPAPIRALVVDALGWTEDYAALDLLVDAARDPHPPVRVAAIDAASRIGHPKASRWIVDLLDDPEPTVRARAIRACQSLDLRAGLPAIARLRRDPSPWVRLRAQQAEQALGVA